MSYAAKYLQANGQSCTIIRDPTSPSYISLKKVSNSTTDLGMREAFWEGLILANSNLVSGEIFQIGNDKYLTMSTITDKTTGELYVSAAKTNATLTHSRKEEAADTSGNITETWTALHSNISAYGQIVTAELRRTDPGLVDNAKYVFQLPKNIGVQAMDRLIYNGIDYQVESVDDIALLGVVRAQLSIDIRA
jgi:head-tail adaptor